MPAVEFTAKGIAQKANELGIVPGRSPISVAAAALFMALQASNQKKALDEVAHMTGQTEVSIKESYNLMHIQAAELFPLEHKFDFYVHALPEY